MAVVDDKAVRQRDGAQWPRTALIASSAVQQRNSTAAANILTSTTTASAPSFQRAQSNDLIESSLISRGKSGMAHHGPKTRRAATYAHPGVCEPSSVVFQTAAHQAHGPVLAQASLPSGTAILLPDVDQRVVSDSTFHKHLLRALAGIGGVVLAFIAAGVIAAWLLWGHISQVLTAWVTVEVVFWVWMRQHAAALDAQPQPHMPASNDPILHFKRLVAHARFYKDRCNRAINWRSYVSKWFKNAAVEKVGLENLKEMLAYGFFYQTRPQLEQQGLWPAVETMAAQLSQLSSRPASALPSCSPSLTNLTDTAACTAAVAASKQTPHSQPQQPPPTVTSSNDSSGSWTFVDEESESVTPTCEDSREDETGMDGYVQLKDGYQPGLSFMAHLWEPLRWQHRPLLFYLIIELLHCITWGALTALGMRTLRVEGTTFYYRPGTRRAAQTVTKVTGTPPVQSDTPAAMVGGSGTDVTPLLFLHGVGVGLLPYLIIVIRLSASGLPLLLPESRHVSMRLCLHVPTACEVAQRVVTAMDILKMPAACVMAHSYGTFVASRLVQKHAQRVVRSLALVDPVCFGMFLPSLLSNFIYRTPLDVYRQGGLRKALRNALIFLISRDVHAAATFCRKFYWTDVNLWAEELPGRSLIVLAGADELLHADEVRLVVSGAYVGVPRSSQPLGPEALATNHLPNQPGPGAVPPPARVLFHPTAGHADWLLDNGWQAEVVEQILSLALGEDVLHQVTRRATVHPTPFTLTPTQPGCTAAARTSTDMGRKLGATRSVGLQQRAGSGVGAVARRNTAALGSATSGQAYMLGGLSPAGIGVQEELGRWGSAGRGALLSGASGFAGQSGAGVQWPGLHPAVPTSVRPQVTAMSMGPGACGRNVGAWIPEAGQPGMEDGSLEDVAAELKGMITAAAAVSRG